ncbi:MAG TPA: GNAT family N-acetyltransferase [Usitatibacter sp.]|nr:GNAT family N-acetyltransferase [Usitatibacter sp.]
MIAIRAAEFPRDVPVARRLFGEYADELGIDLGFQDFEAELASLPGKYVPPRGRLLLAWEGDEAAGCIAMRPVDGSTCEMKRLYVRPAQRARRLGRALVERVCAEARASGYRRIVLDTLPQMGPAIRLYSALGFRPIAPYVFNPIEGALFLGLELGDLQTTV